jgi:undecaprenyl diphosphate synthase
VDTETPANVSDRQILRAPQHVAIVMDGNGRWARQRNLPRTAGHREGVKSVRAVVEESVRQGVRALTLFAFSSENWGRPRSEVNLLMDLFMSALRAEVRRLDDNRVRLRIIGDRSGFPQRLQHKIAEAEERTASHDRLVLQIAANYGGRWDITRAARRLAAEVAAGRRAPEDIDEDALAANLSFANLVNPDLFIRTGGEKRLSNFLLWQCAYTELYFTDRMWPDFGTEAYREALADFARRQRRFGLTSEQLSKLPDEEAT